MSENLIRVGSDINPIEDHNIKKVRFKEPLRDTDNFMAVDSTLVSMESWKDKLLGKGHHVYAGEEDLEFLEGDITRTMINGKHGGGEIVGMKYSLFYLAQSDLQGHELFLDNTLSFSHGPQILIPFCCSQNLEEIESLIGKVTKLEFKTDCGLRGRFARMAVFINLDKLLIPHVLVNGTVQCVEYESLPAIYFSCNRHSHVHDICLYQEPATEGTMVKKAIMMNLPEKEKMKETSKSFGPWMLVSENHGKIQGVMRI
ncbi:hypothetical protein Gohar_016940 [Gossypium harknessii]|uniref:Uncharacterized protein n=1 Tax=Gossypium harknessii TaxID=34285 RepID=A0A7J9G4H3_9ROSI|nr:hypothetical protein [Gossypium harknessii]